MTPHHWVNGNRSNSSGGSGGGGGGGGSSSSISSSSRRNSRRYRTDAAYGSNEFHLVFLMLVTTFVTSFGCSYCFDIQIYTKYCAYL